MQLTSGMRSDECLMRFANVPGYNNSPPDVKSPLGTYPCTSRSAVPVGTGWGSPGTSLVIIDNKYQLHKECMGNCYQASKVMGHKIQHGTAFLAEASL